MQFLSQLSKGLKKSDIQKALHMPVLTDIISFAAGKPATDFLPLDNYKKALNKLFSQDSLQYSCPSELLKEQIMNLMKQRYISCNKRQIFLTSGAQQAIMLICMLLVNKGDNIIVEEASYPGFIQIADILEAKINTVSINQESGLVIEELETLLKTIKDIKLIYTIPTGHNPLGISLSKQKRCKIIEIAQSYKVPIIEDDTYGFINYDSTELPLRYYCDKYVFYVGSFSKVLSPSTRIGWLIVPETLVEKLEILKECLDSNLATLPQHIVASYIKIGEFSNHISYVNHQYKQKRDIMAEAINTYIPEMKFVIPNSGFFIWGKLPKYIDTNVLCKLAFESKKVLFLPGSSFGESTNLKNCLRLSFSFCQSNLIELGIKRLSESINEVRSI